MTEQIVDIADLDCIFLTYDEPKKEEFWIKIQNMVPWAKRVDGVKGSDAAHKAAAEASDTDRFVLIDGDNLPDPGFFNLQLSLNDANRDCVFRWRARNAINGLMYGNGGMSCWTKEFVRNMRTHEASDGTDANDVEFCFYPNYWAMRDCYSTTYPDATPFQAWRAGFREAVSEVDEAEAAWVRRTNGHCDCAPEAPVRQVLLGDEDPARLARRTLKRGGWSARCGRRWGKCSVVSNQGSVRNDWLAVSVTES